MITKIHYTPPAEVYLLALGAQADTLATVVRGYSQVYEPQISPEEVAGFIKDLKDTKLQTPNAFVNIVWLVRNVTRNFEQQLTRYRVGTSFVCESLRFSDKRIAEFYCKQKTVIGRELFRDAVEKAMASYSELLAVGEEVQNARDVLPGSICTHMFLSMNLQTLAHVYEQRRCCQAQGYEDGEWGVVLEKMKAMLAVSSPAFADMLQPPWANPNCVTCGFGASFDRPCKQEDKFDINLQSFALKRSRQISGQT